jgi:hypothetical protein
MASFETVYEIESKTYAALFHTAWHLLDSAEKTKEGRLLNLQAASVFFAFAFEAYLNHVGAAELTFWEEIDRISYTDKLSVLAKHLGFKADKSRRPFQSIKALFDLRNALAHGRTQRVTVRNSTKEKPANGTAWRQLPWEKLTSQEVRRYHNDVRAAVEQIDMARPKRDPSLWKQGSRGYSMRRQP